MGRREYNEQMFRILTVFCDNSKRSAKFVLREESELSFIIIPRCRLFQLHQTFQYDLSDLDACHLRPMINLRQSLLTRSSSCAPHCRYSPLYLLLVWTGQAGIILCNELFHKLKHGRAAVEVLTAGEHLEGARHPLEPRCILLVDHRSRIELRSPCHSFTHRAAIL